MKLLLDTHVFFWWIMDRSKLSKSALAAIARPDHDVVVSVASLWEMSIKVGLHKWPEAEPLVRDFEVQMALERFRLLPITLNHVRRPGLMDTLHRDPFDRLLAAQALLDGLTLVTADPKVQAIGAPHLW